MQKDEHGLLTEASIHAWIADHEPNGVEKLWQALETGDIRGRRATVVRLWFETKQAKAAAKKQQVDDDLERRAVVAAETSAAAALESARHAKDSALWARLSMLISLVALIVSAWPLVKDVGRREGVHSLSAPRDGASAHALARAHFSASNQPKWQASTGIPR